MSQNFWKQPVVCSVAAAIKPLQEGFPLSKMTPIPRPLFYFRLRKQRPRMGRKFCKNLRRTIQVL